MTLELSQNPRRAFRQTTAVERQVKYDALTLNQKIEDQLAFNKGVKLDGINVIEGTPKKQLAKLLAQKAGLEKAAVKEAAKKAKEKDSKEKND